MRLPRELGPIHFIGIGGIGMSGIAEVLLNLGHKVVLDQHDRRRGAVAVGMTPGQW